MTATGVTVPPKRAGLGPLPPLTNTEKIEIARTCHAAETNFVGVNCGLLDPLSSLFGKAFHAIEIDCQSLTIEHLPMIGEIALVVCDTGVKHALVDGAYNELRSQCEAAARALGVKSLRSVDSPFLSSNRKRLTEREYQCAYHIVGENQRVAASSRILRDGKALWQKPFLSGETNMSHSIGNLEHHHFKYALFRRPGDVHVHMFGTATLSFADGVRTEDGDVFEIEAPEFGLPLRNPLEIEQPETVVVKAL